MKRVRRAFALTLPVALLATGGCLATSGDIEKLQLSIKVMQDSMRVREARSNAMQADIIRSSAQQLAQQFTRELAVVTDSLRQLSGSFQRLQGDVTLSMHDLRVQLATVQEGIGQSRKTIQDLRSTVEAAAPSASVVPPAGKPTDPAAVALPPAGMLFQMGQASLRSNATGAAREAFQTLVTNYPSSDRVAEAQMSIADAYAQEGNRSAADSVYALVVSKYAGRPEAARSLYKRAMALKEAGQIAHARNLFAEIVAKYPRSDYTELADLELAALAKKP